MYKNKKILVCGMAKSGQSVAKYLLTEGAKITIQDRKSNVKLEQNLSELEYYFGKDPDDIVDNFDLIIISPGISLYAPFVTKAKTLGIPVWGETELAYRLCPCPIIAITGTNGKTTVTTLVGEILKLHNSKTLVGGNIGTPLTELVKTALPDGIIVAEVSSFQLETVETFKPKISAVLNMMEDHLDRHLTMENYIAMKARIFANQINEDICVLNFDNDITRSMTPPCPTVYFSSTQELGLGVFIRNDYIVAKLHENIEEIIMPLCDTNVMIENALATVAICLCAGVSPSLIAQGLNEFTGVEHRLEYIATIDNISYYNDSKATNISSSIKAIESIGSDIILIAGGYDKNTDFIPLAQSFEGKVKHLIIFGQTTEKIASACKKLDFTAITKVKALKEAVQYAKKEAVYGDTILFSPACASFDMFENFEVRGNAFKKYVKEVV